MAVKDKFGVFSSDGLIEGLGLKALFTFLSAKALRGGPRLLPQIIICAVLLFTLTRLLPDRLSDITLGENYDKILKWRPTAVKSRPIGEGMRIVVFGGGDVATPNKADGKTEELSWTEILCKQLHDCHTHLSYMPRTDTHGGSIVSNSLYDTVINHTVSELHRTGKAGFDYTWLPEQYPVPSQLPDLETQIKAFLATSPGKRPPRETLWVFNYGYWDVWKLASMPRMLAMEVIEVQINHIFEQIEILYAKSRSETSIAYSEYYNWLRNTTAPPRGNTSEMVLNVPAEPFRIFIPALFDISLTPGFETVRFIPPYPHSRAEEMRNAAYLTELWEQMMTKMMAVWISTPLPLVNGSSNETISSYEIKDAKGNPVLVPFPRREVITQDIPKYIRELIVEGQLHNLNVQDKNGLGTKPAEESFLDVSQPCMPLADENTTSLTKKRQDGDAENTTYTTDTTNTTDSTNSTCEAPQEHLFWTEFTVSQRAINEIGRMAARRFKAHVAKGGQWLTKSDLAIRGVEEASWRAVDFHG